LRAGGHGTGSDPEVYSEGGGVVRASCALGGKKGVAVGRGGIMAPAQLSLGLIGGRKGLFLALRKWIIGQDWQSIM
jgi:hypothetical protein